MKLANTLQSGRQTTVFHYDIDALAALIQVFARSDDPDILDCTYGYGNMWAGCIYQPDFKTDRRELPGLDMQMDFRDMSNLPRKFDVIVFDPPHLSDYVKGSTLSHFADTYGLAEAPSDQEGGVVSLFVPFLEQARDSLTPGGVVLCKIIDTVYQNKFWWQHIDFILAAHHVGMTPVQAALKINRNPVMDPKWQTQQHLRNAHAWWIVVRNVPAGMHPSKLVETGKLFGERNI
jgi:hypothetical protein